MMKQFESFAETEKPPATPTQFRKPEPPQEKAEIPPPVVSIPLPEPSATPAEVPKPIARTIPPLADMGRGGAQHQSIQQRLKAVAEELGFRATIEKEVLDGQGSVDLALERR